MSYPCNLLDYDLELADFGDLGLVRSGPDHRLDPMDLLLMAVESTSSDCIKVETDAGTAIEVDAGNLDGGGCGGGGGGGGAQVQMTEVAHIEVDVTRHTSPDLPPAVSPASPLVAPPLAASPALPPVASPVSPPVASPAAAPAPRRCNRSPAKKKSTRAAESGDSQFGMTTGDVPRNGLGAILDFLRAAAIANGGWDESTGTFPDVDRVWSSAAAPVRRLSEYFADIFTRLTFRKHKSGSESFDVAGYVQRFLSRERYITWDSDREVVSFQPDFTRMLWKSHGASALPRDTSKTHTSNFKAAFFNAVNGLPVPHTIVQWAHMVLAGTAWLHSSHLRVYEKTIAGASTKLRVRKRDHSSITGREIVIVPRQVAPAYPLAITRPLGDEENPAKRARRL